MTHASLFSGIGGFDLAAEWVGWTNLFNCEINTFCQQVLKYHFPDAIQYSDILATDFTAWHGRVDVLTGGFPCQPFSVAGKRQGTADARHLWPEMLRAIREISPRWIVGENVRGIVNWSGGLVFEQVCADLEAQGYEVQPFVLPACGVGAPHRRDRIWFVAHHTDTGIKSVQGRQNGVPQPELTSNSDDRFGFGTKNEIQARGCAARNGDTWPATDTKSEGWRMWRANCNIKTHNTPKRTDICEQIGGFSKIQSTSDTARHGSQTRHKIRTSSKRIKHNWFDRFPTQSPVCSRDDGFSDRLDGITFPKWRAESIKAYGNAIVPQVALQIFNTINEIEKP